MYLPVEKVNGLGLKANEFSPSCAQYRSGQHQTLVPGVDCCDEIIEFGWFERKVLWGPGSNC